jgi:hypothetical protein
MSATVALAGWDNFYVIVGSAAAGLTGLTFVVIALVADAGMTHLSGLRTFVTPTVIHFSSALWIAALATVPHLTTASLGVLMLASGAAGVIYSLRTLVRMYRMDRDVYVPVAADWTWNGFLPLAAYALLTAGGTLLLTGGAAASTQTPIAAYLIGLGALLPLFLGIHNVWDLAVWITTQRHEWRRRRAAAAVPGAAAHEAQTPAARSRKRGPGKKSPDG